MELAVFLCWAFLALACASPAPRRKETVCCETVQECIQTRAPPSRSSFSVLQSQEAIQLFNIFYFANNYTTFYKVACWARDRVNEGQFSYALSVAIAKRQDTQGLALPPQSEVYPFLYVNARAIRRAQIAKEEGVKSLTVISSITGPDPSNYIVQNQVNNDAKLSYFREDKDINQLFAYQQIYYPSWFHEEKYVYKWSKTSGERFYYYIQQLLARYNLERFANGLPYVQPFRFTENIQPGYNPELRYHNGLAVSARPDNIDFNNANANNRQQLLNLDRRFADAVDSQQVTDAAGGSVRLFPESGATMLGDLIQSNTRAVNRHLYSAHGGLYGYLDLFRVVVSSAYNQNQAPSAIENEGSTLRDPVFYKIITRVVDFLQRFKDQLQPYKKQEISFQGVKIQSVDVDELETYFDESEVDLYNAINYQQGEQAEQNQFKARQQRLNNKPFNYNIQVSSQQDTDAIVRVFIGPQYDVQGQQYSLEQARQYFVEIDRFIANLKRGENTIKRNSKQSSIFTEEQSGARSVISQAREALHGGQPFYISEGHDTQQPSFPQNLILPKGTRHGQSYVLLVTANSYEPSDQKFGHNVNPPDDGWAQGFPLDWPINVYHFQEANNFYFKSVNIFNKESHEETSQQ